MIASRPTRPSSLQCVVEFAHARLCTAHVRSVQPSDLRTILALRPPTVPPTPQCPSLALNIINMTILSRANKKTADDKFPARTHTKSVHYGSGTISFSAFAKPSHFLLLNAILRLTFSSQLTPPHPLATHNPTRPDSLIDFGAI